MIDESGSAPRFGERIKKKKQGQGKVLPEATL